VRGNLIRGNGTGFFFCWGVRNGLVEGNTIEDSASIGISIGHRDTDNIVRGNRIQGSGRCGVLFREHPEPRRDPHRNLFADNLVEDSGGDGDCVAVELLGTAAGVVLSRNRIVDRRGAAGDRHRIGVRIGPRIGDLRLDGNVFEGMETDVVDQRPGEGR
jgi:parallel beta-helix repeat protein